MAHIIFSRRHHPGSVLLRAFLWSPWSHCGVIDGDEVIQATAGNGVIITPLAEFKAHASRWAIVDFPAGQILTGLVARNQRSRKYDWLGLLGIYLHRRWNAADAWFCSELVAFALEQAGLKLFREDARRITPQHLWMLNYPVLDAA